MNSEEARLALREEIFEMIKSYKSVTGDEYVSFEVETREYGTTSYATGEVTYYKSNNCTFKTTKD